MAVAGFVGGLIVAFGGREQTSTQVTALIMSGASVIAYILGEGMADAGNGTTINYHLNEDDDVPFDDLQEDDLK